MANVSPSSVADGLSCASERTKDGIAIIGMACEFPGAHSPEELWQNVLAGRRYFRKAPKERLPPEYFDSDPTAPDKSYCDQMAVLEGWQFDPVEFGIPPVAVHASDIAHWLALFTAREALKDAGLNLQAIDRARMGVVLGNTLTGEFSRSHNLRHRWPYVERAARRVLEKSGIGSSHTEQLLAAIRESYEGPLPEITEDSLAGNMANTIAGRICGYFDLGGGGYTVDGACSSSLLSVAHACNALVNGEMDFALAGGVDISLDPFEIVGFAKAQALARDDIRPYDERAAGMLAGEGCGIFILMREADARAAGHHIHALVRGWGISSDGAGGITAPEVEGQMRALQRAYERAGYPISSVELIEGHGTGTTLGDKVEISAILRLLDAAPQNGVCHIGSVKGLLGHCKAAAGSVGLTKAIMALKRKILPPTGNCEKPSAVFGKPMGRLRPSLQGQEWAANGSPRRASVSSMGFGGANSHVTLEEANQGGAPSAEDLALLGSAQSSELVLLSAPNVEQLQQHIAKLILIAGRICRAELTDLAAALAKRPAAGKLRLAIVAESPWHLADSLRSVSEQLAQSGGVSSADDAANGIFIGEALDDPKFVALFPGQGSQRLNMGVHLLRRYPFVRELYEQAGGELTNSIFRDTLAADDATLKEWEANLRNTQTAQPAIVLSSVAMLRVLEFFGLKPSLSIGHSLGKISALHAAGACDAAGAIRLATMRGQAIGSLDLADPGAMLAVSAKPEDVQKLIEAFDHPVAISNHNSPRQTVVSGVAEAITRFRDLCTARKVPCRLISVSHAFHSDIVAPAAIAFRREMDSIDLQPLSGRVFSTSNGDELNGDSDLKELLAQQIRRPVRFIEVVQKAAALSPALWLEIGPGGVLTSFVRDILGAESVHCLPTDLSGEGGFHLLNQALARAFVLGFPVATDKLFAHRFHRPFDADNYNPVFIVNPCERPVELTAEVAPLALTGSGNGDNAFLRELSELYRRHHSDVPSHGMPAPVGSVHRKKEMPAKTVLVEEPKGGAIASRGALLTFAIEWIAKRTGFPKNVIGTDKRLRDDLNLDSIKVGELVVLISRKIGRVLKGDPASIANATLDKLVDTLLDDSEPSAAKQEQGDTREIAVQNVPGLGEWVRTFRMEALPAPIDLEASRPLPGSVAVVADAQCLKAKAVADGLRNQGVDVVSIEVDAELQKADALVLLLPGLEKPFFDCSPDEFTARVERHASRLFQIFRAALAERAADAKPLRGLILRTVSGDAERTADMDAGAALVKTLLLEYPDAEIKWAALPDGWSPERWAETVAAEFKSFGRVAVAYDESGQRLSIVGRSPAVDESSAPLALDVDDVVLVSGGAKGITFELALELARHTKAKLALLGSSPPPTTKDEAFGNFERLNEEGIRHTYVQADVTDLEAVRRAVADAERQVGKVTAIFHGAGLTQLRAFRDKPIEEFLHCIRIKARGLYNLLAVVPRERLKALHVISSVLGNSGMRGQVDYTFANAWLDGAVRAFKAAYSHAHCLSLGYSVWSETGLGKKIGALDGLRAIGVIPINIAQGVGAYRRLFENPQAGTQFIITGRLTTDLEANLYGRPDATRGRFLEKILRWVPGAEIIADATLSHTTDLYLPEHVFEGTPMFPGVMAIEAMVQAAQACAATKDLPVLRNIAFRRPLIVPGDGTVVVRTLALVEDREDGTLCVRVAMRSGGDDFQKNHFEAECWFDLPSLASDSLPICPPLPEPLDKHPEEFSPVPLFQGKFFRRIRAIRQQEMEAQSLTDLELPHGEVYYGDGWSQTTATPSPAFRDAALQSGAIILPPGCLPVSLGELRFYRAAGGPLNCHTVVKERSATGFLVEIGVFDSSGALVETMNNMVLQAPKDGGHNGHSRG